MCLVGEVDVLDRVRAAARLTIEDLKQVPELATTATDLEGLLDASEPVVAPLSGPLPGQIDPHELVKCEARAYPSLLADLVGPPLKVGPEPFLGQVAAYCASSTLRRGELQGALSALFLTTLCAPDLPSPMIEVLHHLLLESDAQGFIGLYEVSGWRTELSRDQMVELRRRQGLKFLVTAVQICGTFGVRDGAGTRGPAPIR